MSDSFTGWVRDNPRFGDDPERRTHGSEELLGYFVSQLELRRHDPGDDLLSELLRTEVDGAPVPDSIVLGIAALVLIAGVDTTWSATALRCGTRRPIPKIGNDSSQSQTSCRPP